MTLQPETSLFWRLPCFGETRVGGAEGFRVNPKPSTCDQASAAASCAAACAASAAATCTSPSPCSPASAGTKALDQLSNACQALMAVRSQLLRST